jgi:hypothetical protein
MTMRTTIVAGALALVLAACGGEAGNNAVDSNQAAAGGNEAAPAANDAAPAANQAAPVAPTDGTLNAAFIAGRWTEENACDIDAMEFRADGTMVFPWGETGRWTLNGDTLAMEGNPMTIRLEMISPTEMRANKSSGTTRTWTRCP